ncbi:MAG: YtxH domain-containing protein [Flavobacteriales bacterium]|nr:YtxH domain-containing protein [Flavobacteriales bacterium]
MSTQKTLLAALAGLAAGAAIGVLLAPRSGKETRVILKKKAKKPKRKWMRSSTKATSSGRKPATRSLSAPT